MGLEADPSIPLRYPRGECAEARHREHGRLRASSKRDFTKKRVRVAGVYESDKAQRVRRLIDIPPRSLAQARQSTFYCGVGKQGDGESQAGKRRTRLFLGCAAMALPTRLGAVGGNQVSRTDKQEEARQMEMGARTRRWQRCGRVDGKGWKWWL